MQPKAHFFPAPNGLRGIREGETMISIQCDMNFNNVVERVASDDDKARFGEAYTAFLADGSNTPTVEDKEPLTIQDVVKPKKAKK